ncbi:MAG: hypothetical protein ACE15E_20035 [Acidobacteriota bacterium]
MGEVRSRTAELTSQVLGGLLVAHFVYVAVRGVATGHPENCFWLSHLATLVGGIGILLASPLLVSVALVCLLEGHLVWVSDVVSKWVIGYRWLGITSYLDRATWADWLQTVNHFITVPALLFVAVTRTGVRRGAWRGAALLYGFLLIISATLLPAQPNINSAYRLWEGLDETPLARLNALPVPLYLLALTVLNTLISFWPSNWVLSFLLAEPRLEHSRSSRHQIAIVSDRPKSL